MGKFIIKHIDSRKPQVKVYNDALVGENKKKVNEEVMTTSEKIAMAQSVLNNTEQPAPSVRRVKKDKGLIERTESSKTILTEDNKELLND
jgi:hypothetical protein